MAFSATAFLDLLGDELNRQIIELTDEQPRSADAVADRCDASLPTVYRHVDDLEAAGLLTEHSQYDQGGNHFKTYAAVLEEAAIRVENGELTVNVRGGERSVGGDPDEAPIPEGVEEPGTGPSVDDVERPGAGK